MSIKNSLLYFLRRPLQLPVVMITKLFPYFDFLYKTGDYQHKINFSFWFKQKVLNLGGNKKAYWPVHWTSTVFDVEKIVVGIDSYPGFNGGAYITGIGGLTIGNYCLFAKNIVIVTANHSLYDTRQRITAPVSIGNYCWLGAGAKVMPGITLGDHTIVAAGAVVTRSFPDGYCVVGGIPAKVIKKIEPEKCVRYEHKNKFAGYIAFKNFEKFKASKLKI